MSSEAQPAAAPAPAWPSLDRIERRVLGVLVEKAKTTPDVYPLSINSLVTGSNQKSNRDPLMNVTEIEVEDALASSQKKGLVIKVTGTRVPRWRHNLYDAWHVGKVELAILAELLLRGPQTEGELRSRASRMEPVDDLDALRAALLPMAERGLVVYLSPPGRRGTMLTDALRSPEELEHLRKTMGAEREEETFPPSASPSRSIAAQPETAAQLTECRAEIAALRELVSQLQAALGDLRERVDRMEGG
jgi:uncharacterized protein YceH (UPF0502 family)